MLTEHEKLSLKHTIQTNSHELFVVSFDEMDSIVKSSSFGNKVVARRNWQKIKDKVGFGASYYASADDVVTLTKLVGDLGGIGAKVYIKNYGGKPHIILKGRPGLRRILTGTKYGIQSPKIVKMGLGKVGAVSAAKTGGILTIILLTTYRVIDYVLTDKATLSSLLGRIATDVVKVGITVGASIAAATLVGTATIAIGPIVAVVFVGIGVSVLLEHADNRFKITESVIAGLDELGHDANQYLETKKENAIKAVDSIIDYAVHSACKIAIKWANTQLRNMGPV